MSYNAVWEGGRMRPHGSPAELERRRLRALELLQEGLQPHVVAQRLGVDRRSVRRWKRSYQRQGKSGLKAQPASGRPPQLTSRQRRSLVHCILKGPQAWGFSTALWTCRRIRQLIRERFHVVYHPDHIGRLLRSCGFTPQRPQTRAKERDDQRLACGSMRSGRALKKTLPPPGPPDLPGRNGLFDVSTPAPHLGAARRHADPRCPATAPRKGLGHRRSSRLSSPPSRQPLSGSAPQAEHPRPPRSALPPSPAPPPAGPLAALVGSRQAPPAPTRARVPPASSAVAGGMATPLTPRN